MRRLWLALCLVAAPARAADTPQSTPAASAAKAWLAALAAQEPSKLAEASALPFAFVTDYKRKKCDGTAKDERARAKLFRCLLIDEKLLIRELQNIENVALEGMGPDGPVPIAAQASKVRGLAKKLGTAEGQTTVEGFLNGDGVTFQFLFAVRPTGGKVTVAGFALSFEIHD